MNIRKDIENKIHFAIKKLYHEKVTQFEVQFRRNKYTFRFSLNHIDYIKHNELEDNDFYFDYFKTIEKRLWIINAKRIKIFFHDLLIYFENNDLDFETYWFIERIHLIPKEINNFHKLKSADYNETLLFRFLLFNNYDYENDLNIEVIKEDNKKNYYNEKYDIENNQQLEKSISNLIDEGFMSFKNENKYNDVIKYNKCIYFISLKIFTEKIFDGNSNSSKNDFETNYINRLNFIKSYFSKKLIFNTLRLMNDDIEEAILLLSKMYYKDQIKLIDKTKQNEIVINFMIYDSNEYKVYIQVGIIKM